MSGSKDIVIEREVAVNAQLRADVARLEADNDALRRQLASRTEAIQTSLATTRELRERAEKAERFIATADSEWKARAEKAERERDYVSGYEADLVAIRRVLDAVDAPHDCEDGCSMEPKRIRLLAAERDDARAERDEARANYAFMVERAADQKLDGYRELGARAAAAEERAEKAERERDEARAERDARPEITAEDCDATVLVCALTENATLWPDGHKAADRIVNALRAHAAKAVKP